MGGVEENEAVRMRRCELGLGRWVGGWVGGGSYFFLPFLDFRPVRVPRQQHLFRFLCRHTPIL